jgi:hypothetical protein
MRIRRRIAQRLALGYVRLHERKGARQSDIQAVIRKRIVS